MTREDKELHQGSMGEPCIHCGIVITQETPYADTDKFYNTLMSLPAPAWKSCQPKKSK